MPRQHVDRLIKKASGRFKKLLRSIIRNHQPVSMDITMYWPPDDGCIGFLVAANNVERDWEFELVAADWSIAGTKTPNHTALRKDITSFFRKAFESADISDTKCYLRLHDDDRGVDLSSGRTVRDKSRSELKSRGRLPFSKPEQRQVNRKRNRELVKRGDSLSTVQDVFKVKSPPVDNEYVFTTGVVVRFNSRRKVAHTFYTAPFEHKICGVWIGLHAWQVDQILGPAETEHLKTEWDHLRTVRTWKYKLDGSLFLYFDHEDRLVKIGR